MYGTFFLSPRGLLSPMSVDLSKNVMDVNLGQNTEARWPVFRERERPHLPGPEGNRGEFISPRLCISVSGADIKPRRGCNISRHQYPPSSLSQGCLYGLGSMDNRACPSSCRSGTGTGLASLHRDWTFSSSPGLYFICIQTFGMHSLWPTRVSYGFKSYSTPHSK